MEIGKRSELPIGSASDHDVLIDQLQPQSNKLGVLSFPVIRLVRVAEPLIKTCRSLLMIQSVILSPQVLGSWKWSQRCEWTNDYGMKKWIDKVWIEVGLLSCDVGDVYVVNLNP